MRCKKTKMIDGVEHEIARWTTSCSGCFEGGEYGGLAHNYRYDEKAQCHLGMGCKECEYTGKRKNEMWVPASKLED